MKLVKVDSWNIMCDTTAFWEHYKSLYWYWSRNAINIFANIDITLIFDSVDIIKEDRNNAWEAFIILIVMMILW